MSEKNISLNTNSDIVISTRIRLARNLKKIPFPCKMTYEQSVEVAKKVEDAVLNSNSALSNRFKVIDISKISKEEAVSLAERHLISPEFIKSNLKSELLLLDDESVSIMVNEEDHIRIQIIESEMKLDKAYETAKNIDKLLSESLEYAFDDSFGYLTQCPTNLGTGMRASLMMHLGGLEKAKMINKINSNLSKLGFTLRGFYGEGSESKGGIFQLSNEITLGISEQTAINNLKSIAEQLIYQERSLDKTLVENVRTKDAVFRSLGIIKNAYLISNDEAMELISNIRMGIASGLINNLNVSSDTLNSVIFQIQPATIMKNCSKELSPEERDFERAKILRKIFE